MDSSFKEESSEQLIKIPEEPSNIFKAMTKAIEGSKGKTKEEEEEIIKEEEIQKEEKKSINSANNIISKPKIVKVNKIHENKIERNQRKDERIGLIDKVKANNYLMSYLIFHAIHLLSFKIIFLHYNHTLDILPSSVVIFFCGLNKVLFSTFFMKMDHMKLNIESILNQSMIHDLLIKCLFEFLKNVFIILSLSQMRLVSAGTIFSLYPVINYYILLKQNFEVFLSIDKICFILSFFVFFVFLFQGIYLKENILISDSPKGTFYSIICCFLYAISFFTTDKTCKEFHPYIIIFINGIIAVSISPLILALTNTKFNLGLYHYFLLIVNGISDFFAFYNFQKYNKWKQNQNGFSYLYYLNFVFWYLFSFLVLQEPLTFADIIGSICSILVNYFSYIGMEERENDDN